MIQKLEMRPSQISGQILDAPSYPEAIATINQLVEVVNEQQRQLDALRRTLTKEEALRFDYTTDPAPPNYTGNFHD